MGKYEILPPTRSNVPAVRPKGAVTVAPPRANPGGPISSTLAKWEANWQRRATSAVAERTRAEANLFDAQAQVIEAYGRRHEAAYRLQELPEVLAHERARRRVDRTEELRQVQHRHEVAEMRRQTEIAHVEAALVDAEQALQAQRDHGGTTYELGWKRKKCEILDVELSAAERRAILREHISDLDGSEREGGSRRLNGDASDDVIDDALHDRRAQLNASGLDTSRVDAVIERRSGRR